MFWWRMRWGSTEENGRERMAWDDRGTRGVCSQDECRIISGPILPKCISVVAPGYIRIYVRTCVRTHTYVRTGDIVIGRSAKAEMENVYRHTLDRHTVKNHYINFTWIHFKDFSHYCVLLRDMFYLKLPLTYI